MRGNITTYKYTSTLVLAHVPLVVTVRYDRERYSVEEEGGRVTLALVLDKAVPFPVTVIVSTLDLQDSSIGDAATGELLEFSLWWNVLRPFYEYDNLQLLI